MSEHNTGAALDAMGWTLPIGTVVVVDRGRHATGVPYIL